MLSKQKQKLIRSLEQKKYRREEGLFVAEGPKVVGDLLMAGPAREVFATNEWAERNGSLPEMANTPLTLVSDDELRRISFLQHPQQVLALFPIFNNSTVQQLNNSTIQQFNPTALSLALDGVQDLGNLGTIVRIADWFGIQTIYCSPYTADVYNPKVVQATMGSLARVSIVYTPLADLLDHLPEGFPVYGTLLDGQDLYQEPLTRHGIIVMGNEGRGISADIARRISRRLLIPNYPEGRQTADSLNVAVATAITCAEFRRQAR